MSYPFGNSADHGATKTSLEDMHEQHPPARPIPDRLGRALTTDALTIVFQPIVDLANGRIDAVEALCRPSESSGYPGPIELFADAADHGCAWTLEQTVRRQIFSLTKDEWPDGLDLFINCSPAIIADPRFVTSLHEELGDAGIGADRVVFEITEQAGPAEGFRASVDQLRHAGLRVAIDDLGAGANGLNRVLLLRPEWLKLDREMIRGIDQDPVRQNTTRFFVHFASINGGRVIAEGIETLAELSTLNDLGVRYAQGYFLARPAPKNVTMGPARAAEINDRVGSVPPRVSHGGLTTPLASLAVPCGSAQSQVTLASSVRDLSGDPSALGIAVYEGRRLVGWCDRDALSRASEDGRGDRTLASEMQPIICVLPGTSSVRQGLDVLCARDDELLMQPLLISFDRHRIGAVPARRLLEAIASEELARQLASGIAGLPSRSMADHHLASCLEDPGSHQTQGRDAALVDLRRFTEYNAIFGHELGERVVSDLAMLIAAHLRTGGHDYLAHLGGDRFLVTAPRGTLLPRLERIAAAVDGGDLGPVITSGSASPTAGGLPVVPISLRICFIPDLANAAQEPRDVYRIEQQLRQKGLSETLPDSGRTQLIVDERGGLAAARRTA